MVLLFICYFPVIMYTGVVNLPLTTGTCYIDSEVSVILDRSGTFYYNYLVSFSIGETLYTNVSLSNSRINLTLSAGENGNFTCFYNPSMPTTAIFSENYMWTFWLFFALYIGSILMTFVFSGFFAAISWKLDLIDIICCQKKKKPKKEEAVTI